MDHLEGQGAHKGTGLAGAAFLVLAGLLASAPRAEATPLTESFDGIGSSATAPLPAAFRADKQTAARTLGTWSGAVSATERVAAADMSSSASNGIYNYGAGTDAVGGTDRAVGFLSSGSGTASGNLYAQFTNDTGSALSGVQVSYAVEKYRRGSNPAGFRYQLYYSTDGSTWTSAGADFLTAFAADADNTGYATAPGATTSVAGKTIVVAVPEGGSLYLAWNYSVTSGGTTSNAQALGVDDVSVVGFTATLAIGDATVAEGDSGQADATFTVTLSPSSGDTVTVAYATSDLTAAAGLDYTAVSGTLTFSPGTTSQEVPVPVLGDTLYEADETFRVSLSSPTGAVVSDGQGQGTITNDDPAPPTETFDGIGTSATAPLPPNFRADKLPDVRTVGTWAGAVSATERVAAADMSSTASNGIYNYGAGTDPVGGTDRAVGFLSSGSGTASGNLYALWVNDTGGPLSGVQVSYDVEKYRNGSNPAGFRYQLHHSLDGSTWTSAGADFLTAFAADPDNSGYPTAPGATTPVSGKAVAVAVPAGGSLYLAWNYSVSSGTTTSNAQALGIDNVAVAGLEGSLSIADATVTEGDSGQADASFAVTLAAAASDEVTVAYATSDLTATAGEDYTAVSGTLTFPPGTTWREVLVPVLGDTVGETDETFLVTLSSPTNAVLADAQAVGTIEDDEGFPGVSVGDATVTEGDSGSKDASFAVTLSESSGLTVTVSYATSDQSAAAGEDYTAVSGTVTFPPGTTEQAVVVPVLGDTLHEADETFLVTLSGPTNAVLLDGQGQGTIANDDAASTVESFDGMGSSATAALPGGFRVDKQPAARTLGTWAAAGSATEHVAAAEMSSSATNGIYNYGAGTDPVGGADRAVGFLSSGSGTASGNLYAVYTNDTGVDLTGLRVSYAVEKYRHGSNPAGYRVQLHHSPDGASWTSAGADFLTTFAADADNEGYATAPGATVAVGEHTLLVGVPAGGSLYLAWNYSVTSGTTTSNAQGLGIDDVSLLGFTAALSVGDASRTEGDAGEANASFPVTLSEPSGDTVTVAYATSDQTATAGLDYTAVSGTLTFPPGTTSQEVLVPVLGDTLDEPDETFLVTLSGPSHAVLGDGQGQGTILDDDVTPVASIAGTITVEGTGALVPGASAEVYDAAGTHVGSASAGGGGAYAFFGLPDGTYYVRTANTGGYLDELFDGIPCPGGSCSVTSGTPVVATAGATATASFALGRPGRARVDFDGDRHADVFWREAASGQNAVWLMDGATTTSGALLTAVAPPWTIAEAGDLDGDGKADLLWRDDAGTTAAWLMNGTAVAGGALLPTLPAEWVLTGVGDFGGDGKDDILWTNSTTGDRAVWLMDGLTVASGALLPTLSTDWAAWVADLDGDGDADLFWRQASTGVTAVWLMDGSSFAGGGYLPQLGLEWQVEVLADLDGDGKSDVVWGDGAGERAAWLLDGASVAAGAFLPTVGAPWALVGADDFDGDGKADILWRDPTTGENAMWFMDGLGVAGGAYATTVAGTAWTIELP